MGKTGDPGATMVEHWVIYDHPLDYPHAFVVRVWQIDSSGPVATDEVWLRPTLEEARELVLGNYPDAFRVARSPDDDPTIVETWI